MNTRIVGFLIIALMAGRLPADEESWTDSIEIKGDVRLRHEMIDDDSKDDTRNRQRVRARVGAYADVNENVSAGIRIASGSEDPVSTNQSFDEGFTSKGLYLDMAYIDWHLMECIVLTGGKMGQPFISVSDLIWDGDLTPEGLAAVMELKGELATITAHGGYFWVDEISGDDDRMLYTGQLAVSLKAMENLSILAGGSLYYYSNMEGYPVLVDVEDSFGNSAAERDDGLAYVNEFEEVEGFVELKTKAGGMPVKVYGQYVVNGDAEDNDTGYLAGIGLGKAKDPGSYEVGYNYRNLEKDAVVGAFTDSDFSGGGSNGEGHKIMGKYAIAKNWTAGVTYFMNQKDPDGADVDYKRLQLDLVCKF